MQSKETQKKRSESLKRAHKRRTWGFGLNKGKTGYWKGKKRPPFSPEWKRKISEGMRGEKAFAWKDGRKPLVMRIRHCFKTRQWRSDIFMRDNYTCVLCGDRNYKGRGVSVKLEADHYPKPFYKIFEENNIKSLEQALDCEEFWNINNGRTLCKSCHDKTKPGRNYNKSLL